MTAHKQESRRVAVVGGAGAVGQMMTEHLVADGAIVTAIDVVPPRRTVGVQSVLGDVTLPTTEVCAAVGTADIVLLAVPESVALAAIASLTGTLSVDTLLVETLSVKSRISQALRTDVPLMQALGINPMFAPSLPISGRAVAAVVHNDGPAVARFLSSVTEWGANVVRVGAQQHDQVVAATQALTHAFVLSFGLALADLEVPGDEMAAAAPPPHTVSLALLARVALGRPAVYWEVQAANPFARRARESLAAAVARLSAVVEHGSEADFARLMDRASVPLGSDADYYRDFCAELFGNISGTHRRNGSSAITPSVTTPVHLRNNYNVSHTELDHE